jgi:hypothetical protein
MLAIRPESDLGLPKRIIKRALSTLILIESKKDAVSILSSVFLQLDDFVEDQIYYYLLPYLKTIKEHKENPTAVTLQRNSQTLETLFDHIADAFGDQEFLKTYNGVREMLKQRREASIDEVNYLLYLAERDELIIDKEKIMREKEEVMKEWMSKSEILENP